MGRIYHPAASGAEYMALTGRDWPLIAKHTFAIAMWLTRAERANLPGSPSRNRPSTAVVAHEAFALAAADGSLLDAKAGANAGDTNY